MRGKIAAVLKSLRLTRDERELGFMVEYQLERALRLGHIEVAQYLVDKGVKIDGSLNLGGCTSLRELPEGLEVNYLDLRYCTSLRELPQGLKVRGYLYLGGCTGLRALPQGLTVDGCLDLSRCTSLHELPQGLKVAGGLHLRYCTRLRELPQGLTVGGNLYLSGCTDELKADARRKGIRFYDSVYRSGRGWLSIN